MSTIEDIPYENYPDAVLELVPIIGLPKTLALVENFGGISNLYIPKQMTPDHPIAKAIGYDAAAALSERYHGDVLKHVPLCRDGLRALRDVEILSRRQAGELPKDICRDYGMTERGIWKVLARMATRADNHQIDMFRSEETPGIHDTESMSKR